MAKSKRATFGRVFQRTEPIHDAAGAPVLDAKGKPKRRALPGWYVRLRLQGVERTRYAGADRKTAHAYAAQLARENDRATLFGERTTEGRTFAEVKPALVAYFKAHHGPETWRGEAARVDAVVEHFKQPIRELTTGDVAAWRTDLKQAGRSDATCNRYLAALSTAFRFAIEKGYAVVNVARGLPRPSEAVAPIPYVSDEDIDKILSACPTADGFRVFVRVLADAGLRRGEALRLAWPDVDLRREWKDGDDVVAVGAVTVRESKSKRPRVVPLTSAALEALRGWHAARGPVPLDAPDLVFPALAAPVEADPDRVGGRKAAGVRKPDPSRLTKMFQRAARRAGFPGLRLHDTRHSFASRLAQRGVPLVTVGALAGHSDQRVTQRYAAHLPEGAAAAAIGRLSAGASPAKGPRTKGDGAGVGRNRESAKRSSKAG